ncbi:hypothetical protein EVAR_7155_1 [Eumeta japonica]|uniref:Uncharacterized protein n=1 Tax=Eumeta variegata TaxID=151549 RepID=A0A4C1U6R3_EUMVA|nr:hypothetical protein EVAR_7155_1 [Eumeta japonica]
MQQLMLPLECHAIRNDHRGVYHLTCHIRAVTLRDTSANARGARTRAGVSNARSCQNSPAAMCFVTFCVTDTSQTTSPRFCRLSSTACQAVTHPSTDRVRHYLTSVIGRKIGIGRYRRSAPFKLRQTMMHIRRRGGRPIKQSGGLGSNACSSGWCVRVISRRLHNYR